MFTQTGHPVKLGLVQSLARPGGNITGIGSLRGMLVAKRLELFKEVVPSLRRVLVTYDPREEEESEAVTLSKEVAAPLGLTVLERPITTPQEMEAGLEKLTGGGQDGILMVQANPNLNIPGRSLEVATSYKIPTMYTSAFWAEHGALASYGANEIQQGRQAARLAHKIPTGRSPGEIPVVIWGERSLPAVRNLRPQPGIVLLLYNEPRHLYVSTFERPGGSMTGVTATTPTSITEQVRLLKHAVPHASRLAILWDPSNPGSVRAFNDTFAAAATSGLPGHSVEVRDAAQLPLAIAAAVNADVDALLVVASAVSLGHVAQVVDVARRHRLPAIYPFHEFAAAGGLMSYGVSFHHLLRRTAAYVDQILRGAKAGDLPVERPTKLDLIINLKAAKTLGLTIPPSLLLRADQIIQ